MTKVNISIFQYTASDAELHAKWFDDNITTTKGNVYHEIHELNTNLESETAIPEIITKAKIVYYDLETTGLDPKTQHDGIGKD